VSSSAKYSPPETVLLNQRIARLERSLKQVATALKELTQVVKENPATTTEPNSGLPTARAAEVAKMLGVTVQTVYNYVHNGSIDRDMYVTILGKGGRYVYRFDLDKIVTKIKS
jgi:hypothetical protein